MIETRGLNYGPWKLIFSGAWTGYETSLYENPDRLTLLTVLEKEEEKLKGVLLLLNKYYAVRGDPARLALTIGGYSLVFEKKCPAFTSKYFVLSSGPKYVSPDEINKGIEEIYKTIEENSEKANSLSKGFGVELIDLKFAEEEAKQLFSEPLMLAGLIVPRPSEAAEIPYAKALLGKKIDGSPAEENIQSFANTVVIGSKGLRKNFFHVLMENLVLNGVTVIVFDRDKSFTRMASPNKDFDFEEYPNLQPMGLPLKNLEIGKIAVDLNLLDPKKFREIIGLEENKEFLGKICAELIDSVIEENKGKFKSITDLEEKLLSIKEEAKKFHAYKAVRMMKVLEKAYPGFFNGKTDLSLLVYPYITGMGSIVRIDTSDLPDLLEKTLIYSVLDSIYRQYKEKFMPRKIRVALLIPSGEKIAPAEVKQYLEQGILEAMTDCNNYGIGFCLGTEHEIDLNKEISLRNTLKVEFITEKEIAVKEVNSRPYRMILRPSLSA